MPWDELDFDSSGASAALAGGFQPAAINKRDSSDHRTQDN